MQLAEQQKYEAVVIGTSAGGLGVLSYLFERLPVNYFLPVIVVQHRCRDQKDLLEDVLQHKCPIKIKQADEKEKIKNGVVYIAPPNYHLLIEDDHTFSLSADKHIKFSRPSIDVLFESASLVYQKTLVGIILTGANSDGAEGLLTIKKNGGLTIAQDPSEAQYAYMPLAAINVGSVEKVWNLKQISSFLLELHNLNKINGK
jgi:two-component system, chemotaxis family, protein-glutamate methylesterase/glutaminase